MGQIKRLSANDIARVTGVSGKQCKKVTWHTAEIIVRPLLTLKDYLCTIQNILRDCENESGEVNIDLLDFAIRKNIVRSYAYVDLPDDIDQMYYVLYASDLFDTVCRSINNEQLSAILRTLTIYTGNLNG